MVPVSEPPSNFVDTNFVDRHVSPNVVDRHSARITPRPRKRGRIDAAIAPVLDRLGLSTIEWVQASTGFRQHYRNGDLRLKPTG